MKVLKHNSKFISGVWDHGFITTDKEWANKLYVCYSRKKSAPHGISYTNNSRLALAEKEGVIENILSLTKESLDSLNKLLKNGSVVCDDDFKRIYNDNYKKSMRYYSSVSWEPDFTGSYTFAKKYANDLEKLLKSLERGLKFEEVGLSVVFSGKQKPNERKQVSFTKTKNDVCHLCKVFIPFDQHLRFQGSRHVQVDICAFCLKELSDANQKQIEEFNEKHPEYYDEYATEIVMRSL